MPFSASSRKTSSATESFSQSSKDCARKCWTRGASSDTRGGCAPQFQFAEHELHAGFHDFTHIAQFEMSRKNCCPPVKALVKGLVAVGRLVNGPAIAGVVCKLNPALVQLNTS